MFRTASLGATSCVVLLCPPSGSGTSDQCQGVGLGTKAAQGAGRSRQARRTSSYWTRESIELERQRLREGTVRDAAASARNLATVAGIATDKALLLQGRATHIVENRSAQDIMRKLVELAPEVFSIEADDVEELPAA